MLSAKIRKIKPSATLGITARAKQLKEQGLKIINFAAGEPDFDTPENIKQKVKEALDKGLTKYTPTAGTLELRQAIAEKLEKENNLSYTPEQIIVCCGAKQAIFNAIMALVDEGDEVLLPAPYWVSYPEMINFAGGKIINIPTNEQTDFKVTGKLLKSYLTAKSKLFILNSPSNPTGMVYNYRELAEIADILIEHKIFCISDEIYEKLVYDNCPHISIASLGQEIKNLTIVINGLSKAYSMTGWRVGYAAGEQSLIKAMNNLQDHSTSNITSFVQYAAIEALKNTEVKKMVEEFSRRREYLVKALSQIPGLSLIKPQGAFYVWVNITKLKNKKYDTRIIDSSLTLAELLLEKAGLAVIPGIVFGEDNYLRISYATSFRDIQQGLANLAAFVKKIK